jgi:hypothetical protein
MHGDLAYATAGTRADTERANVERSAELGQEVTVAQQRGQARLAAARACGLSGHRRSKMTPEQVHKAQRMYDSRRFTIIEIAEPARSPDDDLPPHSHRPIHEH